MQTIDFLRYVIAIIFSLMALTGFIFLISLLIEVHGERRWKSKIKVRQILDEIDWGIGDETCLN